MYFIFLLMRLVFFLSSNLNMHFFCSYFLIIFLWRFLSFGLALKTFFTIFQKYEASACLVIFLYFSWRFFFLIFQIGCYWATEMCSFKLFMQRNLSIIMYYRDCGWCYCFFHFASDVMFAKSNDVENRLLSFLFYIRLYDHMPRLYPFVK